MTNLKMLLITYFALLSEKLALFPEDLQIITQKKQMPVRDLIK
jgi:hypothetical protein